MTRDDIIRLAREVGCGWAHNGTMPVMTGEIQIVRFAEEAAAAEREACLDWCRAYASDDGTAQKIEAAIRARGEQ